MTTIQPFNPFKLVFDRYQKICDYINHWLFIERMAFFVLCLISIFFIWYISSSFLLITPQKNMIPKIESLKKDIDLLDKKLKTIAIEFQTVNKQKQESKLQLSQKITVLDGQIKKMNKKLIDPVDVGILLRETLSREPSLQLRELNTLPAKILVNRTPYNEKSLSESSITLQFSGDYFSTINYLQALEKTVFQINWLDLNYTVVKYPSANVALTFSFIY